MINTKQNGQGQGIYSNPTYDLNSEIKRQIKKSASEISKAFINLTKVEKINLRKLAKDAGYLNVDHVALHWAQDIFQKCGTSKEVEKNLTQTIRRSKIEWLIEELNSQMEEIEELEKVENKKSMDDAIKASKSQ